MPLPVPSSDDIALAAEWLDAFDEDSEGYDDIQRVAMWLRQKSKSLAIAEIAKERGLPIAKFRKHLKRAMKEKA